LPRGTPEALRFGTMRTVTALALLSLCLLLLR
jgi:hypothetical protein